MNRQAVQKAKKDARKRAKRQLLGTDIPQVQFDQQQRQAKIDKFKKTLNKASSLRTPGDVKIEPMEIINPKLHGYLTSGTAVVKKTQSIDINRAIWYNDLDRQHTFNAQLPICRSNYKLAAHHCAEGTFEKVPQLQRYYYFACKENRAQKDALYPDFTHREAFLKYWQDSNDDLEMFSGRNTNVFDSFTSDLRAALMSVGATYEGEKSEYDEEMEDEYPMAMEATTSEGLMEEDTRASGDVAMEDQFYTFRDHADWVVSTIRAMNAKVASLSLLDVEPYERNEGEIRRYTRALVDFVEEAEKDENLKEDLDKYVD